MKTKGGTEKKSGGVTRNVQAKILPDFMARDALVDVIGGINKESNSASPVQSRLLYVASFSCAHKYRGGECIHEDCWAHPNFLSQPEAEKTEVILYTADSVLPSSSTGESTGLNLP
jgi:hypothetical protein